VADAALHTGLALGSAGVANGLLKYGVGRLRPRGEAGSHRFRPMNRADHWQSFPSGHVVVAFAVASAVAEEADRPFVTVAGYGAAALVGWSWMYEDRHRASDVIGGAIVGTVVSRATVRWLHERAATAKEAEIRVWFSPGAIGVSVPSN
jgi:membrane-associated phospholipid phosphatase